MSFSIPTPALPAIPKPPTTAQAPLPPVGSRPQAAASQPTYLGAMMTPSPASTGTKTLLGQ